MMRAWVAFASLVAVACATSPVTLPSAPCLPPGVSADFLRWPVVGGTAGALLTESGQMVRVIQVKYQRGDDAVVFVWAGSALVAVDQHPNDTDAQFWMNAQFAVDRGGRAPLGLRDVPGTACDWQKTGGAGDEGGEKT